MRVFGFVRACRSEMRFKEYDTYKALYCTLCKTLGKVYGPTTRMLLSYDAVFMLMLGSCTDEGCVEYEKRRCVCNPLKKCIYCKSLPSKTDYTAAVLVLLSEGKIRDGIADSGIVKRQIYKLLHLWIKRKAAKAAALWPEAAQTTDEYLKRQCEVESKGSQCGIDAAAEPTAAAMRRLFGIMAENEFDRRVFSEMGYLIGKWVYIADAAADVEKDIKSGNFNPFASEENLSRCREKALPLMNTCAVLLKDDFELLGNVKYKPIIENIIVYGLEEVGKKIFKEKKK